jgi:hypothetical protein
MNATINGANLDYESHGSGDPVLTEKSSFIAWFNVEAINCGELETSVNWHPIEYPNEFSEVLTAFLKS